MKPTKKLNQLEATAICGNDISSSCLYVSALAIIYAGQYAWLALLIVAGVLFLFRRIYGVSGLLERMTLDRVLPNFLLKKNRRSAPYRILIMFFLLCISILFITKGELGALAGGIHHFFSVGDGLVWFWQCIT